MTQGSLDGITVIDFTVGIAGPMAAGQLADHGALVIRVEPPGGDPYSPFVSGESYNRGKLSVQANLRNQREREAVVNAVERADVVLQGWRPGAAASLGLDATTLRALNPELVYCTITGYGIDSADQGRTGYDALVSARLGAGWNEPEGTPPTPVYLAVPIASVGAAMLAVIGISAALLEREDTGQGCEVETSLVDGALAFLNMFWEDLGDSTTGGTTGAILDRRRYRLLVRSFRCADGEFLGIHTGANGAHARMIDALGLSGRVKPAPGSREKLVPLTEDEAVIVEEEIPKIFARRERKHWLEILRAADVTAIPVLRQTEAFHTEQTQHVGVVARVHDHDLGVLEQVGIPARLSISPGRITGPAPRTGEDTESVLAAIKASSTKAEFLAALREARATC